MNAPISPERVLPTLNADGSRHRLRPRLYPGRYWNARRVAAWLLIATFVALPLLSMNGKPLVLLDVAHREFVLFGRTFLATDGALLMLLMLTIFAGIIFTTALAGRAWCGWGCPQTVYMEFLFRPIERLFEGRREEQLRLDRQGGMSLRRVAKQLVFLLLSVALANLFLSYFVGWQALSQWVQRSPFEHPGPFIMVAVTTALVWFDFGYFREQMCTVICPYARLQSVLLDERSLLIGYDVKRGEPRSKGKSRPGSGDCIDCRACVVACPTGIDIRQGLQLECIACAACADACDSIMDRIGKPRGLVRYGAQATLEQGKPNRILRPRVVLYGSLLIVLLALLVTFGGREPQAEVTLLRGIGAPFQLSGDQVTNQARIKVRNRSDRPATYSIELLDDSLRLVAPQNPMPVPSGAQRELFVFITGPRAAFARGERAVRFRISDGHGFELTPTYKLLGPSPQESSP